MTAADTGDGFGASFVRAFREGFTAGFPYWRRALLLSGFLVAFAFTLSYGWLRCPTATWFHIPCPSCGSSRAVLSVVHGAWDPHMNPFGLVVAPLLLTFGLRAIWLLATRGNVLLLAEGRFGGALKRVAIVLLVLEVALWVLRFFGLFGGPVPT
ncbi:MAG: DUF2752 domain-containing protein [Polyangiaceae bacterium]